MLSEDLNAVVILYLFVWYFDHSLFPPLNDKFHEAQTFPLTTVPSLSITVIDRGCHYNRCLYA